MKSKLLIVDDSGLARRAIRTILESDGYLVVEAIDGMTALEQYFLEKPDAVMLDLVMSGMRPRGAGKSSASSTCSSHHRGVG